jgi:hypothetical protein
MNKHIKKSRELTPEKINRIEGRRNFLVGISAVGGILLASTIVEGVKTISEMGGVGGLLERLSEQENKDIFRKLREYQVGQTEYTAKPYDNYSEIIDEQIKKSPFLDRFSRRDLINYCRRLNGDKDMQIGSKYIFPVWKKD